MERLDEERAHMEGVLINRFNCLLVVLGAIVVGVLVAKTTGQARVIFAVGAILSIGLGLAVARAQLKLDILMDKILENREHAATFADYNSRRVPKYFIGRYSSSKFLAYVLPIWIALFMIAGTAFPEILHEGRRGRSAYVNNAEKQKKRVKKSKNRTDRRGDRSGGRTKSGGKKRKKNN